MCSLISGDEREAKNEETKRDDFREGHRKWSVVLRQSLFCTRQNLRLLLTNALLFVFWFILSHVWSCAETHYSRFFFEKTDPKICSSLSQTLELVTLKLKRIFLIDCFHFDFKWYFSEIRSVWSPRLEPVVDSLLLSESVYGHDKKKI
jgi:hypothetical protein